MRFSERMGFTPVRSMLQIDSMDDALRNSLWNVFYSRLPILCKDNDPLNRFNPLPITKVCRTLWVDFFKLPLETMPEGSSGIQRFFLLHFFKCEWNEVYDFIEFFTNLNLPAYGQAFRDECNAVLDREKSGYRFVGTHITPITSESEISEIEEALQSPLSTANIHLNCALKLLASRDSANNSDNYRNSIKESICAVESLCKWIAKMPTESLGRALQVVSAKQELHPDLLEGFKKLYWYTCDEDGIRHALMDEPNLDLEDAKYFLVACSAFVNYLVVKAEKAGIALD